MPRPATGETPKRNIRVPDHVWDAAKRRAEDEKSNVTRVVNRYLARYGAAAPPGAVEVDPWDVVNLVAQELGTKLGPETNLAAAVDSAADLLRTLGISPKRASGPPA